MAFSELDLARIDKIVGGFCRNLVPAHMKAKVDYLYEVKGQAVMILEKRPHWKIRGEFMVGPVAKLIYTRSSNLWRLYWLRASGKWFLYEGGESRDLATLVNQIKEDRYCCFFG